MINSIINQASDRLARNTVRVDALSPLSTLSRGYSIAERDGRAVKSISELRRGDLLTLRLTDGEATINVLEIRKEKDNCDGY